MVFLEFDKRWMRGRGMVGGGESTSNEAFYLVAGERGMCIEILETFFSHAAVFLSFCFRVFSCVYFEGERRAIQFQAGNIFTILGCNFFISFCITLYKGVPF